MDVSQKNNTKESRESDLHKGHRSRMDERFRKDPEFENFALHEMLEYLLYLGVPRKDTNELAHRLIERFGSFGHVFYASLEELTQVKGMTLRAACTVASVLPISRWVYNQNKKRQKHKITNNAEAVEFLSPFFYNKLVENIYMVCIDSADYVINTFALSKGTAGVAPFDVREVVSKANSNMASKVIIAHNHPAGTLAPSLDDVAVTSRAVAGLSAVYVTLVDHIIFTPNGQYYSFYQSRILEDIIKGSDNILGGDSMAEVYSVLNDKDKVALRNKKVGSEFLNKIYEKVIFRINRDKKDRES